MFMLHNAGELKKKMYNDTLKLLVNEMVIHDQHELH